MTMRTVLLYVDQESNAERLIRLAVNIAKRVPGGDSVLLVGAHATPIVPIYGGMADAVTGGLAMQYGEAQRAIAERLRLRFLDAARQAGVEARWDVLDDDYLGESVALRELARTADLVVVPQPPDDGSGRFVELAFREVVTGAGRPVLVVPRFGDFEDVGSHVLIGWSPTREATRALYDARALIRPGGRATLLWVSHGRGAHPEIERSAQAMAAALERHDVPCKVVHWTNAEIAIGDALLNEAFERGADLIVTGAYGHSRFYDAIIGATTSHLLAHMTVPVLFAH